VGNIEITERRNRMTKEQEILHYVQAHPGCTPQEILRGKGITPIQQVNQKLLKLVKDGYLKRERYGRGYRYYPMSESNIPTNSPSPISSHPQTREELPKNITKENTLIVISCTNQKIWGKDRWVPTYVPAIYAYTGDSITWFKNHVAAEKGLYCVILSAKYGFIELEHPIHDYNVCFPKRENPSEENEKAAISENSLRNQVHYQPRRFGAEERKLCDFKYVLVRGSNTYVKKVCNAFDSIADVTKLDDELWSQIKSTLGC
jgi:hypothetical protein